MECYSVTINNDGTRIASGGLDGNVKIWDTATILGFTKLSTAPMKNSKSDSVTTPQVDSLPDESLRRPLCSMSRHNGVVTTVKFSPDGRFLASGSDDKICLIWEKDEEQANRPKQFGVEEADLEHWTVRKRLVAHDNDIQDIGWSPDGSLLVTVGLDRSIIIWNGMTFERIKRYDIHQSMVKGIVFDPANKFFATASDDRTVRIFRYYKKLNDLNNYEFQMEHIVMDPFKKSPLTSYFRRMSWSPDGQHIAVPNATNGPVPSIAIISRGNWATDISLIGHEAPCEVCSFSPRLFDTGSKDKDHQFSTVLATAGQDRTLVVWSTATSRPLMVAEEIVSNSITDMCWSPDGRTIYFCCLDGSITCIHFEENELGKVVSEDTIVEQLHRYGADRETTVFPESTEQLELEDIAEKMLLPKAGQPTPQLVKSKETMNPVTSVVEKPQPSAPVETKQQSTATKSKLKTLSQNITITKGGKKRVAPLLVSSSSNNAKQTFTSTSSQSKLTSRKLRNSRISQPSYYLPRLGVQTAVHGFKQKSADGHLPNANGLDDQDNDNEDMGFEDTTTNQNVSEATLRRQRNKSKRLLMELKYPNSFKFVTNLPISMFNNQQILNHEVNTILNSLTNQPQEIQTDISNNASIDCDEETTFSVVVASVNHVKDNVPVRTTMEIRNGQPWSQYEEEYDHNDKIDFNDPTKFIVTTSQDKLDRKYTLYFPSRMQHVLPLVDGDQLKYIVLISVEGTMYILSAESGNYICPNMELGENVVCSRYNDGILMVLTSSGLIYSWKMAPNQKHIKAILKKVSIAAVLNNIDIPVPSKDSKQGISVSLANVKYFEINPHNGSPLVILDGSNDLYEYSVDLHTWTKVLDSWYYLSLEDDHKQEGQFSDLFTTTFADFKQDIKRKKLNKYVFDNDDCQELKKVMRARFNELNSTC